MGVFKYKGIAASGQQIEGAVEAFDEFDALEKARLSCRVVSSVTEVKEAPGFLKTELGSSKVKPKTLSIMCSQFSIIVAAGMSISKTVSLVAEQTADKTLKGILAEVAADVATGRGLADAFEQRGGEKLPAILYETIRAGEESGSLDECFETLKNYFDKTSAMRAKVAQALIYPTFVIILAFVVVAVMMVMVIPTFKDLLSNYDAEMPVPTAILIAVSNFFQDNIVWMVLAIAAVAIGLKLWTKSPQGELEWAKFKLNLPVMGNIALLSNAGQYANTMALLLGAGLQVTRAATTTSKIMDNKLMADGVGKMAVPLEEGRQLGVCMKQVPFMPEALTEMVTVGEETGELEETLQTMGKFYDEETDRATKRHWQSWSPACWYSSLCLRDIL